MKNKLSISTKKAPKAVNSIGMQNDMPSQSRPIKGAPVLPANPTDMFSTVASKGKNDVASKGGM